MFCREHIAQLREHEPAFKEKRARLAAIGLGDQHYARLFREETGIAFPLLVDARREAYRAAELGSGSLLHILRSDNRAARKRANAARHKQARLGKDPFQLGGSFVFGPGNIFQLGGSFVFGPGNVDRFAHLSETFGDNATVSALLAALP